MRPIALIFALIPALLGQGAGSKNAVDVSRDRVSITVPVRGDVASALQAATAQARRELAADPVHGCVEAMVNFEADADGHQVVVIPQRRGQFVRPVTDASDPFNTTRHVMVGEQATTTSRGLQGLAALLLLHDPDDSRGADLLRQAVLASGRAASEPPRCSYAGTAEITVTYAPFDLDVGTTLDFTFDVRLDGTVTGDVDAAPRRATSVDPEVGSCSTSSGPIFDVSMSGVSDGETVELTITHFALERDLVLGCTNGELRISGGYISDFLGRARPSFRAGPRARFTVRTPPGGQRTPGKGRFDVRLVAP